MPHVGNDIVDLQARGTTGRSQDRRFVNRILSGDEKQILSDQKENPDTLLWAFWTAKETAFKAVSKTFPTVSSAPRRYPVTLNQRLLKSNMSGFVTTPVGKVAVSLFIHKSHVHCIGTTGSPDHLERTFYDIQKIDFKQDKPPTPDQQSYWVRKLAKKKIARYLNLDYRDFNIQRDQGEHGIGPPVMRFKNHQTDIDISLSHHGRYVAYAALDKKKGVKN